MTILRFLLLAAFSLSVHAQPYPSKPVKIVVATGAGTVDDLPARIVAEKLSGILGQQFFVENRPGAGGSIGQTFVMKSPPDGYTLLLAGGSMAGARYANANVTYDVLKDFTPISLIETSPFVLVASPTLPVQTVSQLIALARSRPGKLSYATLGPGQIPYWSAALFHGMAGVEALEIQYKSLGDAVADVIAGRVDYYFAPVITALGSREKLKLLAVTTEVRSPVLPELETIAEAALPAYEMPSWRSIMGPAGMKPDVVRTLNQAIVRAMQSSEVRDRFIKSGSVAMSSTPDELRKRYEHWIEIFGR